MNILFYYPSNKRTVSLETLIIELKKKGHTPILLTTCAKNDFHFYLESLGFETFTNEVKEKKIIYYLKQIFFLVKFCRQKKIDFIFSHLQHVNFISVLSQPFIKAKIIIFRHHFQFTNLNESRIKKNRNEILFDKVINTLAKKIIVPSSGVYNGIKNTEKVDINKVSIIPYLYDFSKYQNPVISEVTKIKLQYPCKLRLIMVSRLIKLKRHHLVFPIIKELVLEGYDIKMMVLDGGPEKENLTSYINENNLSDVIYMLGFKTDFVNYMAAADLLIQPSLTDASNSAAKEMALLKKAIAVSKGVGDYDDYVKDNINGYLIPAKDTSIYIKNIIINAYNNPDKLCLMGENLREDILSKFDISNADEILKLYEALLSK